MTTAAPRFDLFLSHATPDKEWVRQLNVSLDEVGLRTYFDENELEPADNFVVALGDGLQQSRFLVVVLSPRSVERLWVIKEWTTFMAVHGPHGRVIPILLEPVDMPVMLQTFQGIRAFDRDTKRVARELLRRIGRPGDLPEGHTGALYFGQDLAFHLERVEGRIRVLGPDGRERFVQPPDADPDFGRARDSFRRLSRRESAPDDRSELVRAAVALGDRLFAALFDDTNRDLLRQATLPNAPRPVLTVRSRQDDLLAWPWELLHADGRFLLRDGVLDLARSTPDETYPSVVEPTGPFSLVVNVSAPLDQPGLHYEEESYRITRALEGRCQMTPTELGTVADLVETVDRSNPGGIHFSGHGEEGVLVFENDVGHSFSIGIRDLVLGIRKGKRDGRLPPFFYLASCHGNDPDGAADSCAARLHREGVDQVVGYHGPIVDELSTRAEEALYAAIAVGHTTRYAVRLARTALESPLGNVESRHRETGPSPVPADTAFPFAWAQLVYYQRGLDVPLSKPTEPGAMTRAEVPERETRGDPRILKTGFIGRRREMHRIRAREGLAKRAFVFQGFGGLGKTTLQFQMPALLHVDWKDVCPLWCDRAARHHDPIADLAKQLSDFAERRVGAAAWVEVIGQVDRVATDSTQRFFYFLQVLLQNADRLLLVLDNLESLLVDPANADATTFATWRDDAARHWWATLRQAVAGVPKLLLVASCRYPHEDFGEMVFEVGDLPPDAMLRLMRWFPSLRRLAPATRFRLVERLAGHPRAVELTDALLADAFKKRRLRQGEWRLPSPPSAADVEREWKEIVDPVLPKVAEKLRANLLLDAIWDNVLDNRRRRMLFRMSLLRRPWAWDLMQHLGEVEGPTTEEDAERLRQTSLLMFEERDGKPEFTLHPATVDFVSQRFGDDVVLRRESHLRAGTWLEAEAKTSPYIEIDLEAGYHLFEAEEYDRAYQLLGSASDWLRNHGRVRQGLNILQRFLPEAIRGRMRPQLCGRLLGTVALAYTRLGQVERAIEYLEQELVISREIGDRQDEGNTLGSLGNAYFRLGQVERAIEFQEQALVISREIGDRQGEGSDLGNLGNAYFRLGQVERAIGFHEEALVISREIGDRRGEGSDLGHLGLAYASLGQVKRAIGFYDQALVISREIGDRQLEGSWLGNLGNAYFRLGQVERAIEFQEQALVISREIGGRQLEGNTLGNLGNAYARLGQVERAIGFYDQALLIGQEIKDPRMIDIATGQLAELRGEPTVDGS